MAYIGNPVDTAFTSLLKQDLTGASGTSLTLTHAVANANDIALYINNVRQEPTEAYSVNGTTVTLTGTVAGTDDIYVIYLARAVQTTVPPDGSVSTAKLANTAVTNAKIADGAINLTSKVTGVLPTANGGTGFLTRPAFLAKKLGGSNVSSGSRIDFETIVINVGNGYTNTGTDAYKFICPTAGLYQLQTQCLTTNNSSANDIDMYINAALHQRARKDVSTAAHNTIAMATIANLSVGDKVYIYVSGGSGISSAGSNFTSFSGYLIG